MVDSLKVEVALEGSEKVQRDFVAIGQAGRQAFLGITEAAVAFSAALAVAAAGLGVKFAEAARDTEVALTQLQKVSGTTFENLSSLQQAFAVGGTSAQQFAKDFTNLSEQIASAGQQAKIRNASKDTVEWANNIDNVRKKFDNLDLIFSPLTKVETKVEALKESLAKLGADDRLPRLAEVFKNLSSDLERAQIGKGLGLTPQEIASLTQGSAALKQLQAEFVRLGLTLTTGNQAALQGMAAQWNEFSALLSAAFQKIGAAAAPTFAALGAIFKTVLQGIVSDFQNMPIDQAIANLGNRLAPAFTAIGQLIAPALAQVWEVVKSLAAQAGDAAGQAFVAGIVNVIASIDIGAILWNALRSQLGSGPAFALGAWVAKQIIDGIKSGLGIGGGGDAGGEGHARGGFIGGRGTGTSDSNLAWVSRGEHIMPALAVAQPGVLAFLEALRRSGGNLSAVLNGMGRFALGGMVPRAMPAFASGGLAGGMSNVTIAFPGLPPIGGLRASSAVVDELHKAAALAQVRSGGRKPSRYF